MRKIDRVGERHNSLLVTGCFIDPDKKGVFWECLCNCGNTTVVAAGNLKRNRTCGKCASNTYLFKDNGTVEIFRKGEYLTTIESDDFERIKNYNWKKDAGGYVVSTTPVGIIKLHRFLMCVDDSSIQIDHKNRDRSDNRRKENLRISTSQQNSWNSSPKIKSARYKGVSPHKDGRFKARIMKDGTPIWLGIHDTAEQAALTYNKKAVELFGKFAYLNEVTI